MEIVDRINSFYALGKFQIKKLIYRFLILAKTMRQDEWKFLAIHMSFHSESKQAGYYRGNQLWIPIPLKLVEWAGCVTCPISETTPQNMKKLSRCLK